MHEHWRRALGAGSGRRGREQQAAVGARVRGQVELVLGSQGRGHEAAPEPVEAALEVAAAALRCCQGHEALGLQGIRVSARLHVPA